MPKILDEKDVVQLLTQEVAKAGGQSSWHRKTGVSRITINKVLRTQRGPTQAIINALDLEIVYRRKKKSPDARPRLKFSGC
jgi:DNA-binding phage protein